MNLFNIGKLLLCLSSLLFLSTANADKTSAFTTLYDAGDSKALDNLNERLRVLRLENSFYDAIQNILENGYLGKKNACQKKCSAYFFAIASSGKTQYRDFLAATASNKEFNKRARKKANKYLVLLDKVAQEEKDFAVFLQSAPLPFQDEDKNRIAFYLYHEDDYLSRLAAKASFFEYLDEEMAIFSSKAMFTLFEADRVSSDKADAIAFLIKNQIFKRSDDFRDALLKFYAIVKRAEPNVKNKIKIKRYLKGALQHYGIKV